MSLNATYESGRFDANIDLAEGWVELELGLEGIENHLRVMVNCSDEYIRGYVDAVDEFLLKNQ